MINCDAIPFKLTIKNNMDQHQVTARRKRIVEESECFFGFTDVPDIILLLVNLTSFPSLQNNVEIDLSQ